MKRYKKDLNSDFEKNILLRKIINVKKIIYLQPKNSNDGYKGLKGAI